MHWPNVHQEAYWSVSEREVLVDGTHRGRSFADGCRDSLGRACPDVAYGEQPGIAGLKRQRSPTQRIPSPGDRSVSTKPCSSRAAHPDSQPVAGSAPMKENRARHGNTASRPPVVTRADVRVRSPFRPVILLLVRT